MAYKTILVHLHDIRRVHRLLDTAVPLASQMEARLVGLCVVPPYVVIPATNGGVAAITVDQHRDAYQPDMVQLKEAFAAATTGQSFQSEWRETDAGLATTASMIIEHGRTADLIITSQQDSSWAYSSMLEEPERVAIESGRPLLLVPNAGERAMPAKRITIAWNGRREATRAVFDSLPLLKRAQEVNVVWINPESDQPSAGDLPAAEICATLARHGVKCLASQATAVSGDVGVELLRQASAFGSDTLVMGCYGHSRLREFILGGASQHVFEHMSMPVLMSH